MLPNYFDPHKSSKLFGLKKEFDFFKSLYLKKSLPRVLMLSGHKGIGKFTLVNHLINFIFNKTNYNDKINEFDLNSNISNHISNNLFPNVILLSGMNFENSKVDDIRSLKKKVFQTNISGSERFIILDDIELFNINSLNALLKLVEEPTKNNHFILINNQSKKLIDTIKSRSLEIKIVLNKDSRFKIVSSLIETYKIKLVLNLEKSALSPGNFLKFNYILDRNDISLKDDFLDNLKLLLNIYKKNKEFNYIKLILYITDYFFEQKMKTSISINKLIEQKRFVSENINNFYLYNLNQNALLNKISDKIIYG